MSPATHSRAGRILQAIELSPGDRVLDLGIEGEAVWPGLSHAPAGVLFASSDLREVASCRASAARSDVPVEARLCESLAADEGPFDLAFYGPPQRETKLRVFEWIDVAFTVLRVGGRLCLSGRRDRGVESYRARAERVFGNGMPGPRAGRDLIYAFEKTGPAPGEPPVDVSLSFEVADVPGGPFRFVTRAGVFSRDDYDPGSRLLSGTVPAEGARRVLDVGCGWGAIGVSIARRLPDAAVKMVDVDVRAVRCAAENAALNGLPNAEAALSDVYAGCPGETFDLIVSNPPFHAGNAVAHPLILGAPGHLRPEGRLAIVVARPGPYLKAMHRAFRTVRTLAERGGYTVLEATEPGPRSP